MISYNVFLSYYFPSLLQTPPYFLEPPNFMFSFSLYQKQQQKKIKANKLKISDTHTQNKTWHLFCVGSWASGLPCSVVSTQWDSFGENWLPLSQKVSVAIALWLGCTLCPLSLPVLGFCPVNAVTVSVGSCVDLSCSIRKTCFPGVVHTSGNRMEGHGEVISIWVSSHFLSVNSASFSQSC